MFKSMFTVEYLIQFAIVFTLVKLTWHARWPGTFTLKSTLSIKGSLNEVWAYLDFANHDQCVLSSGADITSVEGTDNQWILGSKTFRKDDGSYRAQPLSVERLEWHSGQHQKFRTCLSQPDDKSSMKCTSRNGYETTQIKTTQRPDHTVEAEIHIAEDRPALWRVLRSVLFYNPATNILKTLRAKVEKRPNDSLINTLATLARNTGKQGG